MRVGSLASESGVIILLLSILITFPLAASQAADYYVSPAGEDSESRDGSETQPWRTISYAHDRAEVSDGDSILVMDDGEDGNDDYTENVVVTKSVRIASEEANEYSPIIRGNNPQNNVFHVTADDVEIQGLEIYGATEAAAIRIGNACRCCISYNACGMDTEQNNACGIQVTGGGLNVIQFNAVLGNTSGGIVIESSSGNVVFNNEVIFCAGGIEVRQDGSGNALLGNMLFLNQGDGTATGLQFGSATHQNVAAGNFVELNDVGIYPDGMAGGILVYNLVSENTVGLDIPAHARDNRFLVNEFYENETAVRSAATDYPLGSEVPVFYNRGWRYYSRIVGNCYSDYTGKDSNYDGIGNAAYAGAGYSDAQPLIDSIDYYGLFGWSFYYGEGTAALHEHGITDFESTVSLGPGDTFTFSNSEGATRSWKFGGGNAGDQTTWHGWLTFASAPPAEYVFNLTVGSTSDESGADFQPLGPTATATGDGTSHILDFTADPQPCKQANGRHLAVQLQNTGAETFELMTAGAACMIFAPTGSWPAPLHLPIDSLLLNWGSSHQDVQESE